MLHILLIISILEKKVIMQGYKSYEEKLFYTFCLSERVPVNNFYRRLKDVLDLSFIRKYTQEYYGKEGQTSIDPVVFFKLMLIGYLENIPSDRKIVEQAGMRLDMLYFLNYNIDKAPFYFQKNIFAIRF